MISNLRIGKDVSVMGETLCSTDKKQGMLCAFAVPEVYDVSTTIILLRFSVYLPMLIDSYTYLQQKLCVIPTSVNEKTYLVV